MPSYSLNSQKKLGTCHPDLQKIFEEVIKHFDNTIVFGHRAKEEQNAAYEQGKSKLQWPNSNHNQLPSMAVDAAPYPIDWEDLARIRYFAGFVMGVAASLLNQGVISHRARWGGDWNMNNILHDQNFNDLVHFELVK